MMESTLLSDLLRYAHLLSLTAAMGTAFFADLQMSRKLTAPISDGLLDTIHFQHRLVAGLFLIAWITGTSLIWWRTGFDMAQFTPKLYTKLIVVSLLTANAILITGVALPMMRNSIGKCLLDLPLVHKLTFAIIAAISTSSWLLALALGSSKFLATSDWNVLAPLLLGSYSLGVVAAVIGAVFLGRILSTKSPLPTTA